MLFDILFIADWQKIREYRQQLTDLSNAVKTKAELTMIIKLVRKYCYGKNVSSTMLSPGGIRSLGSLQQSIQMEQSRFTTEKSRKDEHLESKTVHRRSRQLVKILIKSKLAQLFSTLIKLLRLRLLVNQTNHT